MKYVLGDSESPPYRTHPLLHAGDDEPQVRTHLLLVRIFLLDALLKIEKAKIKSDHL